jgi:hypothetical protein
MPRVLSVAIRQLIEYAADTESSKNSAENFTLTTLHFSTITEMNANRFSDQNSRIRNKRNWKNKRHVMEREIGGSVK